MTNMNGRERELWTVGELAAYLKVRASWVYGKAAAGAIPCVRVGRYVRFRKGDVDAWLGAGYVC